MTQFERVVARDLSQPLREIGDGLSAAAAKHGIDVILQQAGRNRHEDICASLELFAAEGYRLPELTTAVVPPGIDEADVRRRLLTEYDIEIGGGLGPVAGKVWRIGTMGHTARASNVEMFLAALDDLL